MADSVVSFVLEKFTEVLKHEINLLSGVKNQVKSLENELVTINGFLQNSEGEQQHENDAVKEAFIEQIRDVAREAEDAMDRYIVHVIKQMRRTIPGKLLHSLDVRDVASTITDIKDNINNCFVNGDKYDKQGSQQPRIDEDAAAALPSLRRLRISVERDHAVGLEDHIYKLVNQDNAANVNCTIEAFQYYGSIYGQLVNWEKSYIYFGVGISQVRQWNLLDSTGMSLGKLIFSYLGVPLFKGHPSTAHLHSIADKIISHFDSWSSRLLSFAGRLCLINSVITGKLVHTFMVYKWPAMKHGYVKEVYVSRSDTYPNVNTLRHA